jgi:hypothetical protein
VNERTSRRGSAGRAHAWLLGAAAAALLVACSGEESSAHEIPDGEVVTAKDASFHDGSTTDRLGVQMPGAATAGAGAPGGMDMGAGTVPPANDPSQPAPLAWETPAGWTQVAPTMMRVANFQAGSPDVECYVTVLGGMAGGVLANVNRWRDQLGQPPIDASAVSALEQVTQLGEEAVLVEIDGGDQGMIATVGQHGAESVFVKMVGPKEQVFAQKAAFVALCKSLAYRE